MKFAEALRAPMENSQRSMKYYYLKSTLTFCGLRLNTELKFTKTM